MLKSVLTTAEIEALTDAIYLLERAFRQTGSLPTTGPISDKHGSTIIASEAEDYFNMENIPHLGTPFLEYVLHPRLLGVMEEMVGSRLRLEQSDAHIRRQGFDVSMLQADVRRQSTPQTRESNPFGFHGGASAELGRANSHVSGGLYRFPFVKTLTNLTDLDDESDGGTMVIPGSHKIDPSVPAQDIIDAAMADPDRNIHRIVSAYMCVF